ncbi:hypothetical protein MAR_000761 [Mya arenaria]|uniref:Uncharacterized protein n=1 Tax=Mya arenaria TaxID=6604 RepID=A0ABY7FDX4_MYAAR|nr:hypothetical protein MAR_000761 [Mya arenaria]
MKAYEVISEKASKVRELFLSKHKGIISASEDTTETSFPQEFWEIGAVYFHNHDKDGNRICML